MFTISQILPGLLFVLYEVSYLTIAFYLFVDVFQVDAAFLFRYFRCVGL